MDQATRRWMLYSRLLVPAMLGLALCAWMAMLAHMAPSRVTWPAVLIILGISYAISETAGWVTRRLHQRFGGANPGAGQGFWRDLGASVATGIAVALLVYVPIKLWEIARGSMDIVSHRHLLIAAIPAACIAAIATSTQSALRYAGHWRDAERDALRVRLELLQRQLNPHFLFNTLNMVYAGIDEDPANAQKMVLRLADILRYALRYESTPCVALREEMNMLNTYIALLQERHGSALQIEIGDMGNEADRSILPMALQVLVENAIQHNALHADFPLKIQLHREGDALWVENTLNARATVHSGSGMGLENLRTRLHLLQAPPLRVERDAMLFRVRLPLLPPADEST